jgi:PAS domain S-box-containing protein
MTKGSFESDAASYRRVLIEHVPSMLAYWDSSLHCRFANCAYEDWLGTNPESMSGEPLLGCLGADLGSDSGLRLKAVLQGEAQTFEQVISKPGGFARNALVQLIPHVVDGAVIGVMSHVTDVTRLKDTEAALHARMHDLSVAQAAAQAMLRDQEHFRELFRHASDAIFIADVNGHCTEVNDAGCNLVGYSRDDILGNTIAGLMPPAAVERMTLAKAQVGQGAVNIGEWTLRHKNGSLIDVELSLTILSDGLCVGFVRDIGTHKRALDAERAMAEELERRVTHRTEQLRRLTADLEAAEERERRQLARDLHDDLGQTLAAARIRLAALIHDERAEVRASAMEVDELINAADQSTRSLAARLAPAVLYELGLCPALEWLGEEVERSFGLRVIVEDDGLPKPLSQEARSILYRATHELLINVAKHARAERALVETLRNGGTIVLRVSDTGLGFDPAQIVNTDRRGQGLGLGLGLASIRERVTFIGGTSDVSSAPGEGTCVVLTAPLCASVTPPSRGAR